MPDEPTPDVVTPSEDEPAETAESQQSEVGFYGAVSGSLTNSAVSGQLGMRLYVADQVTLGFDGELSSGSSTVGGSSASAIRITGATSTEPAASSARERLCTSSRPSRWCRSSRASRNRTSATARHVHGREGRVEERQAAAAADRDRASLTSKA